MALIVVHDITQDRDRIINTDYIFNCVQLSAGVRVQYAEGASGRASVVVPGTLAEFAKTVSARKAS